MIKQYFKQAIAQLHQQPVISIITVLGTALAIFLIMLVVMIQQVKVAPFSPESNRNRFLHVRYMSITSKDWREGDSSNGPMSVRTAKECFKSLTLPEVVTTYLAFTRTTPVSLPGQSATGADIRETDDNFWRVFDFAFIQGKPYSKADFDAGLSVAVITEGVARTLFGTTDVVGKTFLLNHASYKVSGVVHDVSTLADSAYGQVWIPFTSTDSPKDTWCGGNMGMFSVTILARSRDDFDKIRGEVERRRDAYNKTISESTGFHFIYRNRPYDQEKQAIAFAANWEPDLKADRMHRAIIFIILLLVPAINLSSMTQSRLRQRVAEIGVRRAFGSTRLEMVGQIIMENLVITLLAGIVGLIFSLIFAYAGNVLLFSQPYSNTFNPPTIDASILLHASTFLYALFFCFVLNLLSSGIPAWRASRTSIVNALGGKTY
ncbi:MAG: ABC transporter permease [Bacteroides sp.]|jgi:putative ABC transport system permease protein|nr:ABC transporter permease [Bacteroides sp.]MCI1681987.1 ABC transporter permease [Bacteroides sp.]